MQQKLPDKGSRRTKIEGIKGRSVTMNNMTFLELMNKGGFVMWIMFFASVLIFTFMLERFWAFAKVGTGDSTLLERVKQQVRQGQIKEAIALCSQNSKSFVF